MWDRLRRIFGKAPTPVAAGIDATQKEAPAKPVAQPVARSAAERFSDQFGTATEIPDGFVTDGYLRLKDAATIRRIGRCETKGPIVLSRCHSLVEFEPTAVHHGLSIEGATHLEALPNGLDIDGDLKLANCPRITALPAGLRVSGSLVLRGCPRLAAIPDDIRIGKDLRITGRTKLGTLPSRLEVGTSIVLQNAVRELPDGLVVRGNLALIACLELQRLPKGLRIGGDLIIRRCPRLASVPSDLVVGGGLEARFAAFTELPEGMSIGTYIDLEGCGRLVGLPDNLRAPYALRLRRCIRLETLPRQLSVAASLRPEPRLDWHYGSLAPRTTRARLQAGVLDLENCVRLTELPADLKVGGPVEIAGTSIKSLPPELGTLRLQWRGVNVPPRVAFQPETFQASEILENPNAEIRRVLLEILGAERLLEVLRPTVVDQDTDRGGARRLLRVEVPRTREPFVFLECRCPSTGRMYLLRVPPATATCHAAAAWTAGFDNPDDYKPIVET